MSVTAHKWRWFFAANIVALILIALAFGREYVGNIQIERTIAGLESQNEALGSQKLSTLDLISELSSEYYLEEKARLNSGLGRPGETRLVIEEPSVDGASAISDEGISAQGITNPLRWYFYFFDHATFEKLSAR